MLFAAIYVPDFPAAAIERHQPELKERALAVLEGKPPLERVFAMNDKARAAGVECGRGRAQAETLPGLALRPRSPAQEASASAALLDCAHAFSPRVEATAPDLVMADIAGLERLFGAPQKIARDLARRVAEVGLEANVGVASNPDAAMHAARGFPGVTVIPAGEEAERLGGLPLDVLALPVEMLETLDRWGVRTFRALAALPDVSVAERLGQEGVRWQRLARGATARTLVPAEPALTFAETMELEYPVELLDPLAFVLARMLDALCARLASRALATNEIRLQLKLQPEVSSFKFQVLSEAAAKAASMDGFDAGLKARSSTDCSARSSFDSVSNVAAESQQLETRNSKLETCFSRTLRFPVPMNDSKTFLRLLRLDLQAHPPPAPVVALSLEAEPVKPRSAQGGLFVPRAPEPEKLELTLARVAGVVGEDRVGAPEVLDTHRPDAFRLRRFVPWGAEKRREQGTTAARPREALVALRRFRPPLRVRVDVRDGRPARVLSPTSREVRGHVIALAGPWRTSGEWWTEEKWMRDEWDVMLAPHPVKSSALTRATEGTAVYRIYRDLASGEWFVDGAYD